MESNRLNIGSTGSASAVKAGTVADVSRSVRRVANGSFCLKENFGLSLECCLVHWVDAVSGC